MKQFRIVYHRLTPEDVYVENGVGGTRAFITKLSEKAIQERNVYSSLRLPAWQLKRLLHDSN